MFVVSTKLLNFLDLLDSFEIKFFVRKSISFFLFHHEAFNCEESWKNSTISTGKARKHDKRPSVPSVETIPVWWLVPSLVQSSLVELEVTPSLGIEWTGPCPKWDFSSLLFGGRGVDRDVKGKFPFLTVRSLRICDTLKKFWKNIFTKATVTKPQRKPCF